MLLPVALDLDAPFPPIQMNSPAFAFTPRIVPCQGVTHQLGFFHLLSPAIRSQFQFTNARLVGALQVSSASSNKSVQPASPPTSPARRGGGVNVSFAVRLSGKGS